MADGICPPSGVGVQSVGCPRDARLLDNLKCSALRFDASSDDGNDRHEDDKVSENRQHFR